MLERRSIWRSNDAIALRHRVTPPLDKVVRRDAQPSSSVKGAADKRVVDESCGAVEIHRRPGLDGSARAPGEFLNPRPPPTDLTKDVAHHGSAGRTAQAVG